MTLFRSIQPLVLLALFTAAPVSAQTGSQQAPPMPKPGPEHETLKMDVGTWNAVVEFTPGPGAPPMTSKGIEVNTIGCGGLCLITDFKGESMPGVAFHGHGVTAWDPMKKKYVGSWTDSMSQGLMTGESTYDSAAKKLTGTMEGPDMTGAVTKVRNVVDVKDANNRVMTAFATGPDGKEVQVMKITYVRKK